MRRMLMRTFVVAAAVLVLSQLVRPARTTPRTDPLQTVYAYLAEEHPAVPVIARACENCHSNETVWPWYSHIAPVSWMVAHHVAEAREAINFSNWGQYRPAQQRKMLNESCEDVREGGMPPASYRLVHRAAALTDADVRAVCSLAVDAE